jgi:hypothetical protein
MKLVSRIIGIGLVFTILTTGCGLVGNPQADLPAVNNVEEAPPMDEEPVKENTIPDGWPSGVFTVDSEEAILRLYSLDGTQAGELSIPGVESISPEGMHVTSPWVDSTSLPSIVYRQWVPTQSIMSASGGVSEKLRDTTSFLAMTGAPGQPVFAFSEVVFEDQGIRSFLYAVTTENAGSASYVLELIDDPVNMPIMPVGMETVGGQPQGVWYTKTAWGIGGVDLIFPITRGLYFYNLTNGENQQAIDPEHNFQGISPDLAYAASKEFDMEGDKSMLVHHLESGNITRFALNPASDRGAGFAVFSPDSRFAAWMEGEGSLMPDPPTFNARVRIGEVASGGVVQEIDSAAAAAAFGWARVSMMKPVGWIDNLHVLVEARSEDWSQVALLKFNAETGAISNFCPGSFGAFVYP